MLTRFPSPAFESRSSATNECLSLISKSEALRTRAPQTVHRSYRTLARVPVGSRRNGANRSRFFITTQLSNRTDAGYPAPVAHSHSLVAHLGTDPALLLA